MVFKKIYRKGKKLAKGYLKSNSAWSIAKTAWKGVKYLKGIINSEKKHFDVTGSGQSADYNGTVIALSAIAQGDTYANRNGNSVMTKNLFFRYMWTADAAVATTSCRCILFMDTMNLGSAPTAADVLQITGASHAILSPLNLVYAGQGRFRILHDRTYALSNTGTQVVDIKANINTRDAHIKFTGTTGTDEGRNMVYCLILSQRVSTSLPDFKYYSRLNFYDN